MDRKQLAIVTTPIFLTVTLTAFLLWWFGFFAKDTELSAQTQCQFDLQSMATLLDQYHEQEEKYPTTDEGLVALKSLFSDESWESEYDYNPDEHFIPNDPWGARYEYTQVTADQFIVSSRGPDGVVGTTDDMALTKVFGSAFVITPKVNRWDVSLTAYGPFCPFCLPWPNRHPEQFAPTEKDAANP